MTSSVVELDDYVADWSGRPWQMRSNLRRWGRTCEYFYQGLGVQAISSKTEGAVCSLIFLRCVGGS